MWILNNKSAHVLEWFLWALNATHQETMFSMFCYYYLGISLEDMDDAYVLGVRISGSEHYQHKVCMAQLQLYS